MAIKMVLALAAACSIGGLVSAKVIGNIDSVWQAGGRWHVNGWSCDTGWGASIQVSRSCRWRTAGSLRGWVVWGQVCMCVCMRTPWTGKEGHGGNS